MPPSIQDPRTVAVFDFDHTLITGDSFVPFLAFTCGWLRVLMAGFETLCFLVVRRFGSPQDQTASDLRTLVKAQLMLRLLKGRRPEEFRPACQKLSRWQTWNTQVRQALFDHKAKGHHIIIASGGLDLYLPQLLEDIPHDALICTETGIEDGILTGMMPSGNCVRERKAELVAAYLGTHGPFAESWGYGNFPHDVPLLRLLKYQILI